MTWTTNIASGSFANIQDNPSLQEVRFAPVEARYFRFTSLRHLEQRLDERGGNLCAAGGAVTIIINHDGRMV